MWTEEIDFRSVSEIRTRSTVYLGVDAILKIDDILNSLKTDGISKIAVVTGKQSYKKCGAWDHCVSAMDKHDIDYVQYSEVTANPTVDHVDAATNAARKFGAQAVLAIGGGSPIDAAKSVAILISHKDKTARDLYGYQFTPQRAVPIVTINTTHGTGTETNRFAVVSIPEKAHKPYIATDVIYPRFSIDDPRLMVNLPVDQTAYVSIDALNHVVEACTSMVANPYSVLLAKQTVDLVARYLPIAMKTPGDLEARYFLTYAAMTAGVSFDNGLLHYTHALEHPLSGIDPSLPHGLGLALLLPSVVKKIYSARAKTLAFVLNAIVPGLKGDVSESEVVFDGLNQWLSRFGVVKGLSNNGFDSSQIEKLVKLVYETPGLEPLLGLAPNDADRDSVAEIYAEAM
ncbi:MAG: iron-containing alcohol dehydrogenase [Deltaproteobacteria bacterium]|nr:iron-containing alcohol dehydrogenase [Deltaproteobacteria bacterium]